MGYVNEPKIHIGTDEYRRLSNLDQQMTQAWVMSFFDCDPDLIEWIEFPAGPHIASRPMDISLIVRQKPERSTLMSERHWVSIGSFPNDPSLLERLAIAAGASDG